VNKLPLTSCCLLGVFAACQVAPESATEGEQGATDETVSVNVLSDAEVFAGDNREERRRIIADTLFAGLQALDADRLLIPPDDSAHSYFQRALAYDPGNVLALEGLEKIVLRYVEFAQREIRRGIFDQAEAFLERASFVNPEHPAIAATREVLQNERTSGDLFFELQERELASRSEIAIESLQDIAREARDQEALFLITAPNDAMARWMYSVMREAVPGYRLRGNIELSNRAGVRLRLPEHTSDS